MTTGFNFSGASLFTNIEKGLLSGLGKIVAAVLDINARTGDTAIGKVPDEFLFVIGQIPIIQAAFQLFDDPDLFGSITHKITLFHHNTIHPNFKKNR